MEKNEKKFQYIILVLAQIHPKAWKQEAMAHKTSLKGCSFKIEILTGLLFFFYLNPDNLV